jgi:hypothetical protein
VILGTFTCCEHQNDAQIINYSIEGNIMKTKSLKFFAAVAAFVGSSSVFAAAAGACCVAGAACCLGVLPCCL